MWSHQDTITSVNIQKLGSLTSCTYSLPKRWNLLYYDSNSRTDCKKVEWFYKNRNPWQLWIFIWLLLLAFRSHLIPADGVCDMWKQASRETRIMRSCWWSSRNDQVWTCTDKKNSRVHRSQNLHNSYLIVIFCIVACMYRCQLSRFSIPMNSWTQDVHIFLTKSQLSFLRILLTSATSYPTKTPICRAVNENYGIQLHRFNL